MMLMIPALVLAAMAVASTGSPELPRGEVVEAVQAEGFSGQSYALYLPKAFTPDRRWPILYVFDPGARGKLAVGLFVEAAESHGWIVVASNNARNGPIGPLRDAVRAIWADTQARLPGDPKRTYFAGMSGGSGPAWELAKTFGAGVILCGGPPRPREEDFAGLRFAVFALAGDGDFNYGAMRATALSALSSGGTARLEIFEGGHGWAPAESLGHGVEWLELLAMRAGTRNRDESLARAIYGRTLERARSLEAASPYHAALLYQAMERDFGGLVPTDEVVGVAQRIGKSSAARDAEKSELRLLRRETEERVRLEAMRHALTGRRNVSEPVGSPGESAGEAWERLESLDPRASLLDALARHSRIMEKKPRTDEVLLSQRTYDGCRVLFIEAAYAELAAGKAAEAVVDFELSVALRPDRAGLRVELAKALLAAKQKKKALASLREALRLGFEDAEMLRREEGLAALRGDREFESLLVGMAAAPQEVAP